jgi:hypothetical protein
MTDDNDLDAMFIDDEDNIGANKKGNKVKARSTKLLFLKNTNYVDNRN